MIIKSYIDYGKSLFPDIFQENLAHFASQTAGNSDSKDDAAQKTVPTNTQKTFSAF